MKRTIIAVTFLVLASAAPAVVAQEPTTPPNDSTDSPPCERAELDAKRNKRPSYIFRVHLGPCTQEVRRKTTVFITGKDGKVLFKSRDSYSKLDQGNKDDMSRNIVGCVLSKANDRSAKSIYARLSIKVGSKEVQHTLSAKKRYRSVCVDY